MEKQIKTLERRIGFYQRFMVVQSCLVFCLLFMAARSGLNDGLRSRVSALEKKTEYLNVDEVGVTFFDSHLYVKDELHLTQSYQKEDGGVGTRRIVFGFPPDFDRPDRSLFIDADAIFRRFQDGRAWKFNKYDHGGVAAEVDR